MAKEKKPNYRLLSAELDEVLGKLEGAGLDIDEALAAYERGAAIIKQLENYLKTAENKVIKVKKQFGDSVS